MKKIIVTGGAGFIGSAVIRHIINNTQHSVVNIDKLTYAGNLESVKDVDSSNRYCFEHVDILDSNEIKRIFFQYQPDIIMHLAAESHVDRSINGTKQFIQTNIIGTYTLLEQARAYWMQLNPLKKAEFRFHHISTDEVYGELIHPDTLSSVDIQENKQDQTNNISLPLFTEATPYAPSSPYSASKAAADHLVRAWHRTFGLPVLITNCSNNYGPYHFPEKLIPFVILQALQGKPLTVYGNGHQIRDWLYVEDHAEALVIIATLGSVAETYNIGGYNEKRNIDVVYKICELLEELAPVKPVGVANYIDLITYVKDRPGHDLRYAIDASKIKQELGWVAKENFENGMRKTVQWYVSNQDWCMRVLDKNYQSEKKSHYCK